MGKLNGSYATLSSATGAYPKSRKIKLESGEASTDAAFFYAGAIVLGFVAEWVLMFIMGF